MKITLKDLLYIVPDLINLFLSGFIFIYTFNWLNNKKIDISILTIWSLFISFLIKSFYSVLHSFIFPGTKINDPVKILIYSTTGIVAAALCTCLKKSKKFTQLFYVINHKSINDDIFDDIIDYDKKTMMNVYLKSSNIYYVGKFSFREENGDNSYISLIEYCSMDKNSNEQLFDPEAGGLCSSVAINLRDIERIEIIYENDSQVWERLIGDKKEETEDG